MLYVLREFSSQRRRRRSTNDRQDTIMNRYKDKRWFHDIWERNKNH